MLEGAELRPACQATISHVEVRTWEGSSRLNSDFTSAERPTASEPKRGLQANDPTISPMAQISEILLHSRACLATAEQMLPLFQADPLTTERLAAHAFFCRCIDHFRAAVMLAQENLDPEALTLVRGIVETTFVIGGLLAGSVTTAEMEAFDRAGRAKGAKPRQWWSEMREAEIAAGRH